MGGEFRLNGEEITSLPDSIASDSIFSGTLEDGSVFIFRGPFRDQYSSAKLISTSTPTADTSTILVDTANTTLTGLRTGQSLELLSGGSLIDTFRAVDAFITVNGGTLGDDVVVSESNIVLSSGNIGAGLDLYLDSELNVHGGSLESADAFSGSEINVFGGESGLMQLFSGSELNVFGGDFPSDGNANIYAYEGSEVNLFAVDFYVDGVALDSLLPGDSLLFAERDIVLSGTFSDGSQFSFELASFTGSGFTGPSFVSNDANLNLFRISAVPEPGSAVLLLGFGILLFVPRSRKEASNESQ
jgi:hypothetical protein